MQLTQEAPGGDHWIRRYDQHSVTVGTEELRGPCIVSRSHVVSHWQAPPPGQLTLEALQPALALKPRILLFAGRVQAADLPTELRHQLRELGIGFETMDRGAASRTYNVLAAEGREVVVIFW